MAEEPQAAAARTGPRRRDTVSAKVLEANRQNLEKARARQPVRQRPHSRVAWCRWLAGWLARGRGWPGSAGQGPAYFVCLRRSLASRSAATCRWGGQFQVTLNWRNKPEKLLKTKDREKLTRLEPEIFMKTNQIVEVT